MPYNALSLNKSVTHRATGQPKKKKKPKANKKASRDLDAGGGDVPPPPPLGRCCACCFHQKTCHANAPPLTEFCMHCATGEDAHPTCVEPRMFKTARLSDARGDTIKLDTENGVWLFCEWEWFTGDL